MSILPILTFPNSLLRKKAKPIKIIDNELKDLIVNMTDTPKQAQGVGLAANQVMFLNDCALLNRAQMKIIKLILILKIIKKSNSIC